MTGPVIDDPAAAAAVGRCLIARSIDDRGETTAHPRPCGWCDYPLEDLRRMADGFNEWAAYSQRSNTFGHHELRVFGELPRDEQERRIVEAQAFPPLEEPKPVAVTPPAHDVDEEGPAWLR